MKHALRAPSPAFVISLIALFVALGGTSYAAITSLPRNSVGTKQLRKNAVTGAKIKNGAVTAAKVNTVGLTVPNALHATSASSAASATTATNATHATSAVNATHATSATNATNATDATSATTAANASALNGLAADGLTRVALMSTDATTPLLQGTETTYGTALSITAPAPGFVLVNGSYSIINLGCTINCVFWGRIRHIDNGALSTFDTGDVTGLVHQTGSMSYVFPVNAGINTFDLRLTRSEGPLSGDVDGFFGEMNAIYSPFGPTGGSTLTANQAALSKGPMK